MKKTIVSALLTVGMTTSFMNTAYSADVFSFVGGGNSVDGGLSEPTGSWFSMLAGDTNSDGIPDQYFYTAMRAAGESAIPGQNGSLVLDQINSITPTSSAFSHNSGNMIDRDWSFLAAWGAHYTTQNLAVTGSGNTRNVDMSGWRISWNGMTINVGRGPALINNNDGVWGNGDDTLDYSHIIADSSGFGGVQYGLHLVGSYAPVPLPAPFWLLVSGGAGLLGTLRRHKSAKGFA